MPRIRRRIEVWKRPVVPTADVTRARAVRKNPEVDRVLEIEHVPAACDRCLVPKLHREIPRPEIKRRVERHPHTRVGAIEERTSPEIRKRARLPQRAVFVDAVLRDTCGVRCGRAGRFIERPERDRRICGDGRVVSRVTRP